MTIVMRAENLTRTLGGDVPATLVRDASLEVSKGEFVAIVGPSGSGKSSLLYLLGLLDMPTIGRVWINDIDTSQFDEDRLADFRLAELGYIFQFHFLLPEFTALENVMLPMQRLGKMNDQQIRERALSLLVDLGMGDQSNKIPKKMSGGQQQRVAIARALANNPQLILADEPTGNLDSAASDNVQKILQSLAHEYGRTVVAVTHDNNFAKMADRIITIVDGVIQKN
jgi:lipoprotein-releasing system ATP-binding protein